jgi:cytochrome c-type biogenesis protein CcmH/NrfG
MIMIHRSDLALLPALLLTCSLGLVSSSFASPVRAQEETPAPAPEPSVEELVAQGRKALAAGEHEDALALLQRATELDGGSLETRIWLLRAWMELGRVNDALDAIDELAAQGTEGAEIHYLYGMAFYSKAKKNLREGADLSMVGMSFEDALGYLKRLDAEQRARFDDALLALAEAAWQSQQNGVAREAAEQATDVHPKNRDAAFLLGRIAQSQFVVANGDEARRTEADAHWQAAVAAFRRAAELVGKPEAPEARNLLARIQVEIGNAHVWKQKLEEVEAAYAEALGWDPSVVDFGNLRGYLESAAFMRCLETGSKAFEKRNDKKSAADATLLWWLGFSGIENKDYPAAEGAFVRAVEKWPAYVNCWYYLGIARYNQQNYEGAVEAFCRNWSENPTDLVASIGSNRELNIAILGYLVGWCAEQKKNEQAGRLSEVQAQTVPDNPIYWNNAGLFYRDAGEGLAVASKSAADKERALALYQESFVAYSRALDLSPEDPAILNDTAVILHYYLNRDLDRAKSMYEKSFANAERELAREDLSSELRELYKIARRDSKNNLDRLARELEKSQG